MHYQLRTATHGDRAALQTLIARSARALGARDYRPEQIEAALQGAFGVDSQLIDDGTYFVAETRDGELIGCGGWSRRRTLYGSDIGRTGEDEPLDPKRDAARVRAFFVHPAWARRGIGRSIMVACEQAIMKSGFRTVEISATLAGEPLYATFGYAVVERYEIPMGDGLNLPVVRMTKQMGRE